jgi:uncharacterized protein (DUF362 family)
MSTVTLIETTDRKQGVVESLKSLDIITIKNKEILIKPNFNTADPAPGSTHNDTLLALIDQLWTMGAKSISLGERSFPVTHEVLTQKGVLPLLREKDVKLIDFDELGEKDWIEFKPEDSHWKDGFRIAKPILDAECLVSTCCLKTHQFGGVFTMSLKLHVGVVPTFRHGYKYMQELHQSPYQQEMIAEVNEPFSPDIILLDGIEAFVDGGPATGKRVTSNVFLVASDRVALDAIGVAILKHLGSNEAIMQRKIFEQRQIARAAELGIGAQSPSEIKLVAANKQSVKYRNEVNETLSNG